MHVRLKKLTWVLIPLFMLLLISSQLNVASIPFREGGTSDIPSSRPPLSVQAEQDNVDSFDVNPKSGRWNVSKDVNTDDLVTDSQLRLTTVENATSSSSEYLMDRGLRKLDSKVEFRLSGDGGGNQTEYFRDVRGDEMDFEEGDTEGFIGQNGGIVSVSNGLLKIESSGADQFGGARIFLDPDPPLDGGIYTKFRIRIKTNRTMLVSVRLQNVLGGDILTDTLTGTESFNTFEFDIPSSSDPIAIISITKPGNTNNTLKLVEFIELIGVLDFATHVEGEIEDTWDWEVDNDTESWTFLNNMNVSEGLLRGTTPAGVSATFRSPTGLTLNPANFDFFRTRLNSTENVNVLIRVFDGTSFVTVGTFALTAGAFVVQEFNMAGNSVYKALTNIEFIDYSITDETGEGNLDGNETLFFDYLLVLGHWADVDSTIGLFDTDSDSPLLNVSLHFTSNNSHPTSSQVSTIEVELMDQDGEIAFNFTEVVQIHGLFLRGKITYDILESDLAIKLEFDNGTRIFRINLPLDFTSQSGRVPALLSLENTPSVFISTYTSSISWQTLRLDFVNAPYKEREWAQIDSPSDPNWLFQNWDGVRIEDDIATENSNWSLTVPFLDSISGTMRINVSDFGSLDFNDDVSMWLQVFGVDSNDGELHRIVKIRMTVENTPGLAAAFVEILNKTQVHESNPDFVSGLIGVEFTPLADFSISLTKDRSILNLKLRFTINELDPSNFVDTSINYTISDILDDPSQEFIIRTGYIIKEFSGDTEAVLGFVDFGFVERDIFADIVKAIVDPIGNFLSLIFTIGFRFLATAFQLTGDIIALANEVALAGLGVVITVAIGLVVAAIIALQTALETAISTLETVLEAAIDALQPFLTVITEAVEALWTLFINTLSDIVDELITLASSFVDFFFDILEFLIPLIITFLGTILSSLVTFLANGLFFFWDALSLPDLLGILTLTVTHSVTFITEFIAALTDVIQFLIDVSWIPLVVWWAYAVPFQFAKAAFEPLAGLGNTIETYFQNLTPVSLLGFQLYFPIGVFATVWLIVLLPADFIGFTALP